VIDNESERFRKFVDTFLVDGKYDSLAKWESADTRRLFGYQPELFTALMNSVPVTSRGNGILKFLHVQSTPSAFDWNSEAGWKSDWAKWKDRLQVFAYDWSGSQFGLDQDRRAGQELLVSILEPGTGQLLETPHTFEQFVTRALVEEADAALNRSFYYAWLRSGGPAPAPGECIGYKKPLFLGGQDAVDNLSLQPMEVYVSFSGQLFAAGKSVPRGTPIRGVAIE
jgi:hypothetical protein